MNCKPCQVFHMALALALAALAVVPLPPAKAGESTLAKRIYLAPDDHTDYLWSLDEEGYRRAFVEMLDYYLDQVDATTNLPPPYQARWNCDGSFWLWTYERNKSRKEFQRLIGRVRDGHMSAPLTALVSCYGGQPAEAVLRGMYYAGSLERRYHLRFPLAVAMENQTLPFGLGALWAGAGAQYSWRGICACASKMRDAGDREHEIYWWKGADGSRLLMKWNSMLTNNQSIGGYAEAWDPFGIVDLLDENPEFRRRYPYRVIGAFGKGWDDAKTLTDEFVKAAQVKTTSRRQVIVSNEEDFFRDFEAAHGADLPEVSASFGNEWDLYCASLADVSARVKRAVEKLRNAEALATLVSLRQPGFLRNRMGARDQAWMNLGLYWEHDWTADGTVISRDTRAAWQRRLARQIESYVNALHQDAARELGSMIRRSGDRPRFFAFNALSWTRTDVADLPWTGTQAVHVVDLATGQEAPSQAVTNGTQGLLRILASDVPPTGYKVFEIRPGQGGRYSDAATVTRNVIENRFYRITFADRGAITSLVDKALGREFAANINERALNDLGPGQGVLDLENAGPVSVTLRATSSGPVRHTSRVTLIRGSGRIELDNEITQNFSDVQTWGFAFNLEEPDIWHEEVGAVIRAKLLGQGGHYSPRNARYDWLTLNHFVDAGDRVGIGMTLANADCFFMRLGHSTEARLDTRTPLISALAGGQVDGPKLGIPNQGDDTHFRYRFALQSRSAFDPVQALRFALEHQNPLVCGVVGGRADYPERSFSLLKVSRPEVFVWALKPAEEGVEQGIILRLWNVAHRPVHSELNLAHSVSRATRTTHLETDLNDVPLASGKLSLSFAAQQLQTYRLTLERP